jgi:hypothetical protein
MRKRLAVVISCGLLSTACGASSRPSNTTSTGSSPRVAFAQCMRSHGVPNFSDPTRVAGGEVNNIGADPESPAFEAAQRSCQRLVPGGDSSSVHASAQAMARALKVSQCMRAHGISGFPDPVSSPPSGLTGYSVILNQNGAVIAIPSSVDMRSPAFKQAAGRCNFGPRIPRPS